MKSYEQIAAAMHAAYEKTMAERITGRREVGWLDIGEAMRQGWIAAARQAAAELALVF